MADIKLVVGADIDRSLTQLRADIATIISKLDNTPPKIKLNFDLSKGASKLKSEIESVAAATKAAGIEDDKVARQREIQIQRAIRLQQQYIRALHNSTAAKSGNASGAYQDLVSGLKELDGVLSGFDRHSGDVGVLKAELDGLTTTFLNSNEQIARFGENTRSSFSKVTHIAKNLGVWFGAHQIIMAAFRSFKQMVRASIELESAFTQLQIVTGATDSQMQAFAETTVRLAKDLGQSVTDVAKSVETFSRLGYSLPDATELSKYATILANVAAVDTSEATTGLTSIIKGFGMDVIEAEHVADVLIQIGQKYAVSASEMMQAYERSGAALNATNTTFEKSAALIAAANASVQDASVVGTALKTISARIRGSKTDLDSLGESMEGLANGFSKYAKEIKSLTGFDIMVDGTTDQFKDLYDIMDGIAAKWDQLSDTQRARVAEILGGTRQLQVISSIIGNWGDAVGAYADAMNAAGVATSANELYMETAAAKLNQFKATFQELSMSVISSGTVSFFIDFGKGILSSVNALAKLNLLLPTLVAAFTAYKLIKSSMKVGSLAREIIAGTAANMAQATSVQALTEKEKQLFVAQIQRSVATRQLTAAQAADIIKTVGLTSATKAMEVANYGAAASFKALMASIPVWGWVSLAISALIPIISAIKSSSDEYTESHAEKLKRLKQEYAELKDEVSQIATSYRNLRASADDVIPRFAELAEKVGSFGEQGSLTNDEYKEFLELNNRVAEMFPQLNLGMDDNGNAMLALSYSADTLSQSLWDLVEAQRAMANQELADTMPNLLEKITGDDGLVGAYNAEIDELRRDISTVNELMSAAMAGANQIWGQRSMTGPDARKNIEDYIVLLDAIGASYKIIENSNPRALSFGYGIEILGDWPENTLQRLDGFLEGYERKIRSAEGAIGAAWRQLNPVAQAWLSTDYAYQDLPKSMQDIAASMISAIDFSSLGLQTEEEIHDYVRKSIILPLFNSDKDVKDAFAQIINFQDQLKDGVISTEQFADLIRSAFEGLKDSMSVNDFGVFSSVLSDAFQSDSFDGVVDSLINEWAKVPTVSNAVNVSLSDLSSTLSQFKSNYDLLTTAQKEAATGGLTASTIKSISDAVKELTGDESRYLDYLYEENGVIKLNAEAWRELINAQSHGDIDSLEQEATRLLSQKQEIEAAIASLDTGGYETRTISTYKSELAQLNTLIDENQQKLNLYKTLLGDLTINDPYSIALQGVTNEVLPMMDGLTSALTTLANVQREVTNGFTISLEKAREFAAVYPELLDGATLSADGQITLNESVVNSFIDGKHAEMQASIDAQITSLEGDKATLTAKMELARAQLELARSVVEGESKMSTDEAIHRIENSNKLAQALIDNGMAESDAYAEACRVMSENTNTLGGNIAKGAQQSAQNIAQAAEDSANAIDPNTRVMRENIASVADQAHNAALAVSGIGDGVIKGSSAVQSGAGGGRKTRQGRYDFIDNGFDKENYNYSPQLANLEQYISDLEVDISKYQSAIDNIDGQIAILRALRERGLGSFASSGSSGSGGAGNSGGSGSSSNSISSGPNWFELQYKLHQHLLNMDAESVDDYLSWLNDAYQRAYQENIITLDDFYKYQEEVYHGLQNLFKDYLSDMEHEISMRKHFEGEESAILGIYRDLLDVVEREIASARARGLKDTDDYIQQLQDKWWQYHDAINDIEKGVKDNAKNSIDALVKIRVDMLKQEIQRERDALKERLNLLKDFYQKQKDMLREQYDEARYLEDQAEKRQKIANIQSELAMLTHDDSAWAQARRRELLQQLADAQKELDRFEREHAFQSMQDWLDALYERQEAGINSEIDLLEEREQDAIALYQQALDDIKNGSIELYEEMIQWNSTYGDGIESTIKDAWEEAYKALLAYKNLYGSLYEGIDLGNHTGYNPGESWGEHPISGSTSGDNSSVGGSHEQPGDSTPQYPAIGSQIEVKKSATHYSSKSNNIPMPYYVPGGRYTVYKIDDGQVLIGRDGVYTGWIHKHDIVGYARGTRYAAPGIHGIDEIGSETIFQSKDGSRYKLFYGGEKVLDANSSKFLYDFARTGGGLLSQLMNPVYNRGHLAIPIGSLSRGSEVIMGDIIINGSADQQTVSQIRRAQRDAVAVVVDFFSKLGE